jgi:hypothetical protein
MSISSSAVLTELNISVWPAKKLDRTTTAIITANAVAVGDAAQVKKNLFAGTAMRSDIEKYAARIRLYHNQHTLPWADKGSRLLPSKLFMDYKKTMNNMRDGFDNLCDTFYAAYPQLVEDAKLNLGTLYDADDYPPVEDVRAKFGFRLAIDPIPSAGDFRLDVGNEELEELKQSYEAKFEERVNEAMSTAWDRLHELLSRTSEKLADSGGDDASAKKRYHDTLITNAQDLCGLLTKLNVTNDPKLEEARRSLELTMLGQDIESIKESPQARSELKTKVDDILKKFEW